jgi:hypothetical protein
LHGFARVDLRGAHRGNVWATSREGRVESLARWRLVILETLIRYLQNG